MEDHGTPLQFRRNEDSRTTNPGRGRGLQQPTEDRGPYETTYTITLGYPDREVVSE